MSTSFRLKTVPSEPCELDFAWYDDIRRELVKKTLGQAECVLDVGCGRGATLLALAKQISSGIGIDRSDKDIAAANRLRKKQRAEHIKFRRSNAAHLPFPARSFDAVLCLGDVLSYSNLYGKGQRVISEIRRVLKNDGCVIHQCMNWDWEYNSYPPCGSSFTRDSKETFVFHRWKRTASGQETTRDFDVLPNTPVHRWLLKQAWPISPQGYSTSLDVIEQEMIPKGWLRFRGVSRHQNYTPRSLKREYAKAGFRSVETFPYGQTYDIAHKSGKLRALSQFQRQLAKAEAEVCLKLRTGSGPWLFLVARK